MDEATQAPFAMKADATTNTYSKKNGKPRLGKTRLQEATTKVELMETTYLSTAQNPSSLREINKLQDTPTAILPATDVELLETAYLSVPAVPSATDVELLETAYLSVPAVPSATDVELLETAHLSVSAVPSATDIELLETAHVDAIESKLSDLPRNKNASQHIGTNKSARVELAETRRVPLANVKPAYLRHQLRRAKRQQRIRASSTSASLPQSTALLRSLKSEPLSKYLKPVMNRRQQFVFYILIGIWWFTLVFFWSWWLRPAHIVTLWGMTINTLILLWSTILPGYYFFFVARMHQPDPSLPLPEGRIAMIVTKAPSEPWSVVKKTLLAMKNQNFPRSYDVWLADESPSDDILKWCINNDIWVSCRQSMDGYHNMSWPRRQKSKEGNLSYFYDTCGYDKYDLVVQLDADHVPEADYLYHMVAPFRDPSVGYVAAPSICDANASSSWAARARLYCEAGLHGAMQAGHSFNFAPLCIGSHYAVRTKALEEIGGLGPELAEDHSTTLLFNAHGWRGTFAFSAIAHGDGPECFADFVTQEFQWSRSLTKLLFTLTPTIWRKLPWRKKVQFLFSQLWYPISCANMLMICLLPMLALASQTPMVNVNYPDFLLHFMGIIGSCLFIVLWIKRQGWLRPFNAKILSWETWHFPFVTWPWMLQGVIQAIISVILKKELAFRVTPKGVTGMKSLPGRVLLPYTIIVISTLLFSLFLPGGKAHTYHYFALMNICFYTIAIWTITLSHIYENRDHGWSQLFSSIRGAIWPVLCASASVIVELLVHHSEIVSIFLAR